MILKRFHLYLLLGTLVLPLAHAGSLQVVTSKRIIQVATAAVKQGLARGFVRTDIRVIGRPGNLTLPKGRLKIEAGTIPTPWPRARLALPVRLIVNGRVLQVATVWFAIQAFQKGLVYAHAAGARTPTAKLQVRQSLVDATGGALLETLSGIRNERLKHSVRVGEAVRIRNFEPIPDVDAQERVRVEIQRGPILIQAIGTALASGMKGTLIPVLLRGATRPFQARVIGKGEVIGAN